jgi:hypothetical protein
MPSDFWGWIGFIIVVSTGTIGVGAVLVIGLFHWWHERFGIFFKNRSEYIEFTKWRKEKGIANVNPIPRPTPPPADDFKED